MAHSAYIHIPFCSFKCDFCDFAAFAGLDHLAPEYCEVVCGEISGRLAERHPELKSVFYGGGTPGLIAPELLGLIHKRLQERCKILPGAEISLETTPHSICAEKAQAWFLLGINRISIGVQTFFDEELLAVGRDHTRAQALEGIKTASAAGFENISCDMMYGLPEQTLRSFGDSLDLALSQPIRHLSAYALTIEANSPLLSRYPRGSPAYPGDELSADMYGLLVDKTEKAGFRQYEISNFALPGYESSHNLSYWSNDEYFAFGVGAHRYVDGVRSANWRSLKRYMRDCFGDEIHEGIDEATRTKEAIFLSLRTRRGIDMEEFAERYGVDLRKRYAHEMAKMLDGGLMEMSDGRLRLSQKGVMVSNLVLAEFM